jgi:hypothetical protein
MRQPTLALVPVVADHISGVNATRFRWSRILAIVVSEVIRDRGMSVVDEKIEDVVVLLGAVVIRVSDSKSVGVLAPICAVTVKSGPCC